MIYLASPYSHPDPRVERDRFERVRQYATEQMNLGVLLFSPIVYGFQFHVSGNMAGDHMTWLAFNRHMIYHSTSVQVYMLEGTSESKGVAEELLLARKWNKDVEYIWP